MKTLPACEILVLFIYWQKPALIIHADAVEPAALILVYIRTIKVYAGNKGMVSLHIYTGSNKHSFLKL